MSHFRILQSGSEYWGRSSGRRESSECPMEGAGCASCFLSISDVVPITVWAVLPPPSRPSTSMSVYRVGCRLGVRLFVETSNGDCVSVWSLLFSTILCLIVIIGCGFCRGCQFVSRFGCRYLRPRCRGCISLFKAPTSAVWTVLKKVTYFVARETCLRLAWISNITRVSRNYNTQQQMLFQFGLRKSDTIRDFISIGGSPKFLFCVLNLPILG
jgi:hypothetical protein